jgi:hypothetical protein
MPKRHDGQTTLAVLRCYPATQDSPNAWPYEWGRVKTHACFMLTI